MTRSHGEKKQPSVIGTGLISLDIVIGRDGHQLPQLMAGGTCGNVLTILSFLGWAAYPVARLNGDTASKLVVEDLNKWGVRLDFATSSPGANTPIIVQRISQNSSGESVHRFSWSCPVCGTGLPAYKPILASSAQEITTKLASPTVFFFDRVSRGVIILAKASAAAGALVVFEPSAVGDPKLFQEALSISHIIKYSNQRLGHLSDVISKAAPPLQIETLGSEGLRYRSNISSCRTRGWRKLESLEVSAVKDTAGAGDWCTAGLLHHLGRDGDVSLRGIKTVELHSALRLGQALGAWSCCFEGARGGLYTVERGTMWENVATIMLNNLSRAFEVEQYHVDVNRDPANATHQNMHRMATHNTCLH